ncbi:hypothetical protein BC831DRAFT_470861 [Entophlyctis helioformis]|nr:hypothetical protein BC831DRAFT_470861 [Entophlyctis helioformis]
MSTLSKLFADPFARKAASAKTAAHQAIAYEPPHYDAPRSAPNIGHGGPHAAPRRKSSYNESLALMQTETPTNRSKRRLLWVEFNGRADVVDVMPFDTVAGVLKKVTVNFANQMRGFDASQLRLKVPASWVPGSVGPSAGQAPHTFHEPSRAKEPPHGSGDRRHRGSGGGSPRASTGDGSGGGSHQRAHTTGSYVPASQDSQQPQGLRSSRRAASQQFHPSPSDPSSISTRSTSHLSHTSSHRAKTLQSHTTGLAAKPAIVIPNLRYHEGVTIGEICADVASRYLADMQRLGQEPMPIVECLPTEFPAILTMINSRYEAFEIVIDESTLSQPPTANAALTAGSHIADIELVKFWQQLPHAVLEDDILSLPAGVYFLGDPALGSKMYVRHAYKELALGIESSAHWQRGRFFGLWMLYLVVTGMIEMPVEQADDDDVNGAGGIVVEAATPLMASRADGMQSGGIRSVSNGQLALSGSRSFHGSHAQVAYGSTDMDDENWESTSSLFSDNDVGRTSAASHQHHPFSSQRGLAQHRASSHNLGRSLNSMRSLGSQNSFDNGVQGSRQSLGPGAHNGHQQQQQQQQQQQPRASQLYFQRYGIARPVIIWDSHLRNELIIFNVADMTVTTGWSRVSSHLAFYHSHVWYISDGDLAPLLIPAPTSTGSKRINIRKTLHLTSSDTVPPAVQRLPGFTVLTLPSWNFAESERLYYGYPEKYANVLSYGSFTELVYMWGGNPLLVLSQSRSPYLHLHLATLLQRVSVVDWLESMLGLQPSPRLSLSDTSPSMQQGSTEWHPLMYMLVHASTDPGNYVVSNYKMASLYVAQVVARLMAEQRTLEPRVAERVSRLWRFEGDSAYVDSVYPHISHVRKALFLGHMHNILTEGGVFKIRKLGASQRSPLASADSEPSTSTSPAPPAETGGEDDPDKATLRSPLIDEASGTITIPPTECFLFDAFGDLSAVSHFAPADAIQAPNILFRILVSERSLPVRAEQLGSTETQDSTTPIRTMPTPALESTSAQAQAQEPAHEWTRAPVALQRIQQQEQQEHSRAGAARRENAIVSGSEFPMPGGRSRSSSASGRRPSALAPRLSIVGGPAEHLRGADSVPVALDRVVAVGIGSRGRGGSSKHGDGRECSSRICLGHDSHTSSASGQRQCHRSKHSSSTTQQPAPLQAQTSGLLGWDGSQTPARLRFKLLFVVPTDELFDKVCAQPYKIHNKAAPYAAEAIQWAEQHVDQYVLKLAM